jgi:hypothetical protein
VTQAWQPPLPDTPFGGLLNIAKESVKFLTPGGKAQKSRPETAEKRPKRIKTHATLLKF